MNTLRPEPPGGPSPTFRPVAVRRWTELILRFIPGVGRAQAVSTLELRISGQPGGADAATSAQAAPSAPAPAAPRPRRRATRRKSWRASTDEVVDGLTLEPLAADAVAAKCPRCGAAYGKESLACLILRNDGRCAACGSRRVSSQERRRKSDS
jgi:hypothetical protein